MVPATVCLLLLCMSVWMHVHIYTVPLFVSRFAFSILFQHWQLPTIIFLFLCLLSRKSGEYACVCVHAKHRGASGLCLLDIGGPCTPMMVWHKDCCLSSHKSSHSFCFALPSPQRPPSFLTLSILAGEWSQGVRWGQSRHVPMPVALGIHSNSTWLVGRMYRLNKRTCVFTAAAWSMLTFYL